MNPITFDADPEWAKRFNEYLRSHKRALDSFRALIAEGIPQEWLLGILHDYSDRKSMQAQQAQQQKSATSSLKKVRLIAKTLSRSESALEDVATNASLPDWVRDHHFHLRRSLSALVKDYSSALGDVMEELARLASGKGEGISEALLAMIVEAVSEVTGQPRWQDLANLIEGSFEAHELRFDGDADTVRKRYSRFVKNFPRIYESSTGFDWKCFFGVETKPKTAGALEPENPMERLIRRFPPTGKRELPTKPRYGKIHTSMKH